MEANVYHTDIDRSQRAVIQRCTIFKSRNDQTNLQNERRNTMKQFFAILLALDEDDYYDVMVM